MTSSKRKRRITPVRTPQSSSGFHFNLESIPSWIAMLATLGTLIGFYYNTNYSISDLKNRTELDSKARDQLRESLSKNSEKTSEAISKLTEHAAIQDERTKNITDTLQNIQGTLSSITTAIVPIAPRKK